MAVDLATSSEVAHSWLPLDAPGGSSSDATGTGERRSAGNDGGRPDGADIGVDRIIDPAAEADDEDPDLARVDRLLAESEAPDGLPDDEAG